MINHKYMEDVDILNVPAFKRKRSLGARARRKTPTYTQRKPLTRTRRRRVVREEMDESISDIQIHKQPTIEDVLCGLPAEDIYSSRKKDFREMSICGRCEGYFDKIDVAVIQLTSPLREGDSIIFETDDGLFEQVADSIQIDRKNVRLARSGSDIGIKALAKPKVGGNVYKVI